MGCNLKDIDSPEGHDSKCLKCHCKSEWPDVNFLSAVAVGIWFSDGKMCQGKSMGKAKTVYHVVINALLFF